MLGDLVAESTSSPMTMFMGMTGLSIPATEFELVAGEREVLGKRPREWKAASMDSVTCICFF